MLPLIRSLTGHGGPVLAVVLAPNGSFLASGSQDTTLKIWESSTGAERATLAGHKGAITTVAVGPLGDFLVSGSQDTTLKIWDSHSGAERATLAGHEGAITTVAMAPRGNFLVSGSQDTTLKIWHPYSGAELNTLAGHRGAITTVTIARDGNSIISGSEDGTLRIWRNAPTGAVAAILGGNQGAVTCAAMTPDEKWIVSGSNDGMLRIWDVNTGGERLSLPGHSGGIAALAITPDGQHIVSGSRGSGLILWKLQTGERLRTLSAPNESIVRLVITSDGQRVVSAAENNTIYVRSLQSERVLGTLSAHQATITALQLTPDDRFLVSGSLDGSIKLWQMPGAMMPPPPSPYVDGAARLRPASGSVSAPPTQSYSLPSRNVGGQMPSAPPSAYPRMPGSPLPGYPPPPAARAPAFSTGANPRPERADPRIRMVAAPSVPKRFALWLRSLRYKPPEQVDCSVFAPPVARPMDSVFVQVFVHIPLQARDARALAMAYDQSALPRGSKSLEAGIARGARLMFDLAMAGLQIDDPRQSLFWHGTPESVQFAVTIPADQKPGNVIGTVIVSCDTVPIGHIKFKLEVALGSGPQTAWRAQPAGDEARRYSQAFVSYASKDRNKVLARVQMLKPLGIRYFQDVLDLDPGDRWEQKLYIKINECDLFLLFWSSAAKESEWVLKEVRYALARKKGDDLAPPEILPIIIEGPPVVPPPAELAHLHFNDRLVYFMQGSSRE